MSKKRPITAPKSSGKIQNYADVTLSAKSILEKNSEKDEKVLGNSMEDFRTLQELGRGSYGVVYHVLSCKDNCEYVIKRIILKNLKEKKQREAVKEVHMMRKLSHPHIIKYYNSFLESQSLFIVMEYANGGDLAKAIKKRKERGEYYAEEEIWRMAREMCSAVSYLHDNRIIHRDIKTLNIFLTREGRTKIGDLGVSKAIQESNAVQATRVGTPLYLAPEMVKHQPYTKKVDVWALGCVLYHACAMESPFLGENLITLGFNIVYREPRPLPSFYSKKLWNFILKFLVKEQTARPKIRRLLGELEGESKISMKRNETVTIYKKEELADNGNLKKERPESAVQLSKEPTHERKESSNKVSNTNVISNSNLSPKVSKPPSMKSSMTQNDEGKGQSNFPTPRPQENLPEVSEEEIPEDKGDVDESMFRQLRNLKSQRPMTADLLHKYKVRPFSSKIKGPIIRQNPVVALPKPELLEERKIEDFRPKSALTKFEHYQPKPTETVKTLASRPISSMFKPSLIEYAIIRNPNFSANNLNTGTFLRNNFELVSQKFFSLFAFNIDHLSKSDYFKVETAKGEKKEKNPFFASRKKREDVLNQKKRPSTAVLKRPSEASNVSSKKLTIKDLKLS